MCFDLAVPDRYVVMHYTIFSTAYNIAKMLAIEIIHRVRMNPGLDLSDEYCHFDSVDIAIYDVE